MNSPPFLIKFTLPTGLSSAIVRCRTRKCSCHMLHCFNGYRYCLGYSVRDSKFYRRMLATQPLGKVMCVILVRCMWRNWLSHLTGVSHDLDNELANPDVEGTAETTAEWRETCVSIWLNTHAAIITGYRWKVAEENVLRRKGEDMAYPVIH